MPKASFERTIDSKSGLRAGGGVFNAGGGSAITDHGLLNGLADDDHPHYLTVERSDARHYTEMEENAWRVAHLVPNAHHNPVSVTAPLTVDSAQALALTLGFGVEVNSNALRVKRPTNSGLALDANGLAVGTPSSLSVSSTNAVTTTTHAHAVNSSADPDASASLLATTAAGLLTLRNFNVRQAAQSNDTFASGFAGSGWRIDYGITETGKASAEFDSLTIRGRMRVYELLIQQIRATNGSLFVSSSSKVVTVTAASNAWTVNGAQLTFNGGNATFAASFYAISTAAAGDSSRSLYHGFLYGDLIVAQQVQWNGSAFANVAVSKLEVTAVANLTQYTAVLVEGDAPAVGYDYVRRGNSVDPTRQGAIYLTSDDSNAPFIDIVDGLQYHSDWNSASVRRVRLGKLTGISDADFGGPLDGYGLYANRAYIKGKIIVTGGNAATTDYVASSVATGVEDKATITYVDTGLAGKLAPAEAAAAINANTTTIDGGKITALSITAAQIAAGAVTALKINVATLSAITANLGTVTAGSIVTGSTNKLWLNDGGDGALAIGGAVKASAPFLVSAAGHLKATDAEFGDLAVDSVGIYINALSTWLLGTRGYKFKHGSSVGAGMTSTYNAGNFSALSISNNATDANGTTPLYSINSSLELNSVAGGAGKSATVKLRAWHGVGGTPAEINVSKSDTATAVDVSATFFRFNTYGIWHAGNLTPGNYALLAGASFQGDIGTSGALSVTGAITLNNTIKFVTAVAADIDWTNIPNGQIWLYMHEGTGGRKVLKVRGKGTSGGQAEATIVTTGP